MSDEKGWVIEKRGVFPVEYLCASSAGFEFTTDSLEAIRFCRREDANQIARGMDVVIVEHMWCGECQAEGFHKMSCDSQPPPLAPAVSCHSCGKPLEKLGPNEYRECPCITAPAEVTAEFDPKAWTRHYMDECGYTEAERPCEHHQFKTLVRMFGQVYAAGEAIAATRAALAAAKGGRG